uniref:RGS-like domain-containing protein n=1 Tax=Macrostomum lignano TaxID=282301 RepID=A0A1I8J8R9_9PLAT
SRRHPLRQSSRRNPQFRHKNSLTNSGRKAASVTPEPKEVDNSGPDVNNSQADDAQLDQQQEASSNVAGIHDSKEAESKPEDDAEDDDEEDPDISIGQFVSGSTSQMPVSDAAESKLKALMDAFSDVQQLKQNKPMLMLFLHLLLSRPNQSAENSGRESLRPLLFDLLVDDWTATSASLKTKHARRAAYEIYSTFLHPQAPLSLSVAMQSIESSEKFEESLADASQSVSRLLESSGQDDGTKAQLALCFDKAQNAVRPALVNLVSSAGAWLRARQRDGFDVLGGGDFLPPGCESAIASLLRGGGGVSSIGQQLFNCQRSNSGAAGLVNRQRLSIFTGSRSEKTRFGSHSVELASFHSIRHCVSCKALLSGPGPQGYLCTGECGHTIHRVKDCADKLAALPCKRNSNKSLSTKRPRPASCIIREDQGEQSVLNFV